MLLFICFVSIINIIIVNNSILGTSLNIKKHRRAHGVDFKNEYSVLDTDSILMG